MSQQLLNKDNLIRLTEDKSIALDSLVSNQKESNSIQALQFQKDIKQEKRKTKRWRKVAFIQTVGIVGLVIILL